MTNALFALKAGRTTAAKPSPFSGSLAGGFDAPLPAIAADSPTSPPRGFDASHLTDAQFGRELGIMLAYVRANEGRKMTIVPGHPDIDPSWHAKMLCDLKLVREIGSYHFITTPAGRAILWGLVLNREAKAKHLEGSHAFYDDRRQREEAGEELPPAPYEAARARYRAGGRIADNPHQPGSYAHWDWETAFLQEFDWDTRDGGYGSQQGHQITRHDR